MSFVNPYNFVRSEYSKKRNKTPTWHEKIHPERYTGRMECCLEAVSRLTTRAFDADRSERWNTASPDGQKSTQRGNVIYGTSLKGVIRSVAEAISESCFPVGDGGKCTNPKQLCICCRMFGWLHGGNVFAGRVHITDARPEGNWQNTKREYLAWQALSSPRLYHEPFYHKDGEWRGRKFYYHQRGERHLHTQVQRQGETAIVIVPAGFVFRFKVDFDDLDAAELGLLIYALELEEGRYHKVGKGKPLGLGTAKIAIEHLWLYPQNRYEVFDAKPQEQTDTFKMERVENFFKTHFGIPYEKRTELPHIEDLHEMLKKHDDYPIHYPSQTWFDNVNQELPTALEVAESSENWLEEE